MSRKKRGMLIALFVLIFLGVGSFAVIYSQGWRLDLATFHVTKVGAIYLRAFPADAAITLDGKPVKNASWLLASGTFINNLFPKEYRLRLSRDGYADWQRTVTVSSSLVSEVQYAVLLPKTSVPAPSAPSGTLAFWPLENSFVFKDKKGLWFQSKKVTGDAVLESSQNSGVALTQDTATTIFLFDAATASSTNISALARRAGFGSPLAVKLNPQNGGELIAADTRIIGRYGIAEGKFFLIPPISSSTLSSQAILNRSLTASRSYVSYVRFDPGKNISHLVVFDMFLNRAREGAAVPGKTIQAEFLKNDFLVLLQDDGESYSYSVSGNALQKIGSSGLSFAASGDGNRLAVLERESVEIFSFEATGDYRRFRLPDNQNISRLTWYKDGAHCFIYYADHVSFLDTDDTRLENFKTASDDPDAFYSSTDNALYEIKNGGLMRLQFPG